MKNEQAIGLWRQANGGSDAALGELIRNVQDLVFRFCLSRLSDRELAIEATQETALRIVSTIDRFNPDAKFSTWVLGIANNVVREIRRNTEKWNKASLDAESHIAAEQIDPSLSSIHTEQKQSLHRGLDSLSDRQKEAVILRYFEELSIEDVAQVMQISVGTVKATLHQALKKLKDKMDSK